MKEQDFEENRKNGSISNLFESDFEDLSAKIKQQMEIEQQKIEELANLLTTNYPPLNADGKIAERIAGYFKPSLPIVNLN